jgi:FMN-dependent oxidoreductase (nitrilotriacetate monooxygenase family)
LAAKPFHLGWFVDLFRAPGWCGDRTFVGSAEREWAKPDFYVEWARALERACFDFILCAEVSYISDTYEGSMRVPLKYAYNTPKHDMIALFPIIARETARIGLAATLTTTEWHPFALARYIASLDRLSEGRAGWNIVTGSNDRAAQNFGHDAQPPHDVRYEMAAEFVDLTTQLLGSWEPDAIVMDEEAGVFTDHTKVHPVDFVGKYYRSRGPLDTAPGPQGRPVFIQAGGSPTGRAFAARWADLIITTQGPIERMKSFRDDIHRRLIECGRDVKDCKIVFVCNPVIGDSDAEAHDRASRQLAQQNANLEPLLASMSSITGIDLSRFDPDQPLPQGLKSNGHQSVLDQLASGGRPLRELAVATLGHGDLVGSPDTVAAKMGEMAAEIGGDGFMFTSQSVTRRYISEIADGLVPALQRRGLVRDSYTHAQFRDHLREF